MYILIQIELLNLMKNKRIILDSYHRIMNIQGLNQASHLSIFTKLIVQL